MKKRVGKKRSYECRCQLKKKVRLKDVEFEEGDGENQEMKFGSRGGGERIKYLTCPYEWKWKNYVIILKDLLHFPPWDSHTNDWYNCMKVKI